MLLLWTHNPHTTWERIIYSSIRDALCMDIFLDWWGGILIVARIILPKLCQSIVENLRITHSIVACEKSISQLKDP